jgi:hypothetical protein
MADAPKEESTDECPQPIQQNKKATSKCSVALVYLAEGLKVNRRTAKRKIGTIFYCIVHVVRLLSVDFH